MFCKGLDGGAAASRGLDDGDPGCDCLYDGCAVCMGLDDDDTASK